MSKSDKKIDPAEYQKRLDRMTEMFSDMVSHAEAVSLFRCPYRDRHDLCTAEFICRNQVDGEDGQTCGHDGQFDYRSAWESQPKSRDRAKRKIAAIKEEAVSRRADDEGAEAPARGLISHDGETHPSQFGMTIFDFADELEVEVATSCQRMGNCHECVVEIRQGAEALAPRTDAESFLRGDYRLACQAAIARDDVDIDFVPLRRRPRILTTGRETPEMGLAPLVERRDSQVFYDGEPIDRDRGGIRGLAIDLGTTTVVMELIDLETGESIATGSFENPQRFGGSDVMNRISYDGLETSGDELQQAVVGVINQEIREMARRLEFPRQTIYEIVVAGNSTMRDILFGLDVQSIGQKPYKSLIENDFLSGNRRNTALLERAWDVGLRANRQARLYSLPLIASHVGADTAACLAALDFADTDKTVMLVDMGTNTEVVLRHDGQMYAASCPAGPAFEGGLVKFGMPAYDGAIESLTLTDDGIDYHTIGDAPAEGLCGSGLIDLLAELRRHERLTAKGVFADDRKRFEIALVPDRGITFSKEDASNLAQAKAANYCGQFIVLRTAGVNAADIDTLYLAGGFANYIAARNAIDIGLLAPVPEDRIAKVGNAALDGARTILLSRDKRDALQEIVKDIQHIELETTPDFFDLFVEGCQFKPMPAALEDGATKRNRSARRKRRAS